MRYLPAMAFRGAIPARGRIMRLCPPSPSGVVACTCQRRPPGGGLAPSRYRLATLILSLSLACQNRFANGNMTAAIASPTERDQRRSRHLLRHRRARNRLSSARRQGSGAHRHVATLTRYFKPARTGLRSRRLRPSDLRKCCTMHEQPIRRPATQHWVIDCMTGLGRNRLINV